MLTDNASSHGRIENLLELVHADVSFLSKNTSSILQTLDAGVIACVQQRYRRKLYECALFLIENENNRELCSVNLLQAMQWVSTIWSDIEGMVIYNCWEQTKLIKCTNTSDFGSENGTDIDLRSTEGEDDCFGFIEYSELVQIGLQWNL